MKLRSNQCWFAEQARRAKYRLTKEFRKAAAEELGVGGIQFRITKTLGSS
jgi:hypothetical protein